MYASLREEFKRFMISDITIKDENNCKPYAKEVLKGDCQLKSEGQMLGSDACQKVRPLLDAYVGFGFLIARQIMKILYMHVVFHKETFMFRENIFRMCLAH